MTSDEEPCDETFEIDSVDIMVWGRDIPLATHEGVTLRCSRGHGHQPDDVHSDGVTEWRSS